MSNLETNVAAVLKDLDSVVAFDRPVIIFEHLVPLIQKHSGISEVSLVGINKPTVKGMHLSNAQHATLFYQRCSVHHEDELQPSCPGCQAARFFMTKELVHCLDGAHEKTPPTSAAHELLLQLVKQTWQGPQAMADGTAGLWAIELLVRYRHRILIRDGLAMAQARANDDYSNVARQYAVPQWAIKHAFGEELMQAMASFRTHHCLPLNVPPC